MSEKIKGYFLVKDSMVEKKTGISQKIRSQVKAMNNNGLNCELLLQKYQNEGRSRLGNKIERYLPWGNINPVWDDIEEIKEIQFLYFRHPKTIYSSMIKQIANYKKLNPDLKIFMEIPTYPYEYEYVGIKNKYLLSIDKYNRMRLKGLIDCIFISDSMRLTDGSLFGIECKRFINGYDVKNTSVPCHVEHADNRIVLTCVAMFSFWHGYERLLYGLKNYLDEDSKKYQFEINFVGEGPELGLYKQIVKENRLEDYVIFHGKKFGDELDEIYASTDIGISCLGCYKKKIDIIGDLKTREYFAKGIPTISGCKVDLFADGIDTDFYREVSNDASPIDMCKVIEFHEFLQEKRMECSIAESMHDYSIKKFDYNNTILPVTNRINEMCTQHLQ